MKTAIDDIAYNALSKTLNSAVTDKFCDYDFGNFVEDIRNCDVFGHFGHRMLFGLWLNRLCIHQKGKIIGEKTANKMALFYG